MSKSKSKKPYEIRSIAIDGQLLHVIQVLIRNTGGRYRSVSDFMQTASERLLQEEIKIIEEDLGIDKIS